MISHLEEPTIRIQGLSVQANGRQLLDIPALTIMGGERVALVGPNGAGKSSLLKVISGFLPVHSGSLCVLGRRFGGLAQPRLTNRQWRELRAETGQIMQGLHLVSRLSALENVMIGALARPGIKHFMRSCIRLYAPATRCEALDALEAMGLADKAETRADRLSGGERQKVSLARLRLQAPRLILADEPTSALDPSATLVACDALVRIAGRATLLSVVHDPSLLPRLADRVIGLRGGRIQFDMTVDDLGVAVLENLYAGDTSGDHNSPASCRPMDAPVQSNSAQLEPAGFTSNFVRKAGETQA